MSFAADFHMPGAYHFDGPNASGQVLSAGIFRPPVSPSASTYNLAKSTGSLYSDVSMSNAAASMAGPNAKRKRTSTRESTPMEWNMNMDGAGDMREEDSGTGQTRYTLAGQIDTPGSMPTNGAGILDESVYSDVDYRRALGSRKEHGEPESPAVRLSSLRYAQVTPTSSGWSTFAFSTIGGVVGKVWQFCKGGAFRGFQAGGGQSYELQGTPSRPSEHPEHPEHTEQSEPRPGDGSPEHNVPGGFPRFDYYEASTPESTPQPAAKRRQVSEHNELQRNWVLVDEPQSAGPKRFIPQGRAGGRSRHSIHGTGGASNRRINVPVSRLSGGPHMTRRASLRISHAGSPNLSAREPASFAQPRSPVTYDTPSRIPAPSHAAGPGANPFAGIARPRSSSRHGRVSSPAPSPNGGHRRNTSTAASTASGSRRGRLEADDIEASPRLSAEAKQLAQKKLAAERDTDARVDAFNARLLKMIRQGKEALGTTVEVLDDGEG
ncbi:hypothetical protein GQ53DRAFT_625038, partial [Thozetella sp. PMI_491]